MNRFLKTSLIVGVLGAFASSPMMAADKPAEKNAWTLSFPESKARFVKVQLEWAKKDPYWKPSKEELEAKFDELDTDKDGKLSEEEWNNRDAPKPKKKKKN